jgi:hypothetical protein
MRRFLIFFFCAAALSPGLPSAGAAGGNPVRSDSVMTRSAPAAPAEKDPAPSDNEIRLEEIQIQGEVEKPSVIILPKRIEPEPEPEGLNRSFSREITKNADDVPKPDKAISKVEPVRSIKKEIEKKRQ